jgi:hypothetical protein
MIVGESSTELLAIMLVWFLGFELRGDLLSQEAVGRHPATHSRLYSQAIG